MALSRLRSLIRRRRRLLRVWHHAAFQIPIASAEQRLGIEPSRADHVLTWLLARRLVKADDVEPAHEASWEDLLRVHDSDYLARLDDPSIMARILGLEPALFSTASIIEMWRRSTGATTDALAWAVQTGGCAVVLSGGFHHAHPAAGTGFCGINDVAVAVRVLRLSGYNGKVAIIDVDAHPPDGLAACLSPERDGIRLISVGVQSNWETPDWAYDHRVPSGGGDAAYLKAVEAAVKDLGKPDVVIVLAGADPLDGDRFGGLATTPEGLAERDKRLFAAIGDRPTVLLPAGGYTPGAWRVFATTVATFAGESESPAPSFDPLMHRTRRIMRTLDPDQLGTGEAWLTGADVAEALGMPTQEHRFLGLYTKQGVAYALTRYGLLDTLRRMGFEGLDVHVDAQSPPHLLRITAIVEGEKAVLFEMSARERRICDLDTLFIEWLTLRDPRVPFATNKPRLPGQDAPGLGLGEQALVLIRALAERASFDGVSLVPSHFHVAWMVRDRFFFLDPTREGRFRAVIEGTLRQPLHRVSERLDGPGIPTEWDEVLIWDPGPMMWPLTGAARDALDENAEEARAVRARLKGTLLPA